MSIYVKDQELASDSTLVAIPGYCSNCQGILSLAFLLPTARCQNCSTGLLSLVSAPSPISAGTEAPGI